jgi:outer membrane protein assembly factor BamD (BamD/ComL family)
LVSRLAFVDRRADARADRTRARSPKFDEKDSAEKLYADARDDMSAGSYDQAIKTLEQVEGRAARHAAGSSRRRSTWRTR